MTKDPNIFLQNILESIKLIEKRMKDISQEGFANNIDLQDMVIRRLEIIGEAVRNLPIEFRKTHQEINWQDPADMRSVLIHNYLNVDTNIVWDTISEDLPVLKEKVKKLLAVKP